MQKFGLIMRATLEQMYEAAFYLCSNDGLENTQSIVPCFLSSCLWDGPFNIWIYRW